MSQALGCPRPHTPEPFDREFGEELARFASRDGHQASRFLQVTRDFREELVLSDADRAAESASFGLDPSLDLSRDSYRELSCSVRSRFLSTIVRNSDRLRRVASRDVQECLIDGKRLNDRAEVAKNVEDLTRDATVAAEAWT